MLGLAARVLLAARRAGLTESNDSGSGVIQVNLPQGLRLLRRAGSAQDIEFRA